MLVKSIIVNVVRKWKQNRQPISKWNFTSAGNFNSMPLEGFASYKLIKVIVVFCVCVSLLWLFCFLYWSGTCMHPWLWIKKVLILKKLQLQYLPAVGMLAGKIALCKN